MLRSVLMRFVGRGLGVSFLFSTSIFLLVPVECLALTPIARTDVVPYQRIEYGTTFQFGVVAFSKAGIDRVEFDIAGQGYSGGIKISSTMALNTRLAHSPTNTGIIGHYGWPGVWEYYVNIASSEFTSDGAFSVTPTVYGNDAGLLVLPEVTLLVEALKAGVRHKAWVDPVQSDGAGTVGAEDDPFPDIDSAVAAAQADNGGSSDGNIIYLQEGTYSLSGTAPSTTAEWLTIKNAHGASRDKIIIDDGGPIGSADYLKFEGVSLYSGGLWDYVIAGTAAHLWVHRCKLYAVGRLAIDAGNGGVRPIVGGPDFYSTDTLVTDVDRAYGNTQLVRNGTIYHISEDVFQNTEFAVNIRVDDVDPEDALPAYPHADAVQAHTSGSNNRIYYNYFGTDLHYQGLFLRNTAGPSNNNAYVNIFMEMREPGRKGSAGGSPLLTSGAIYGSDNIWTHTLLWHCSFPYRYFNAYGSGGVYVDSSFIGNLFWELRNTATPPGAEPDWSMNANAWNNDFLYNHYKGSYTELAGCSGNPQPAGCAQWYSKAPDSSSGRTTFSHGGMNWPEVLNLADTVTYTDFGYPLSGSVLIDRLPSNLTGVPADVFGNPRDSTPDVGALEAGTGTGSDNEPSPEDPNSNGGGSTGSGCYVHTLGTIRGHSPQKSIN